jgi:hypothetical protein
MFCSPGLVLGGTEGDKSYFHVLRSRTYFGMYRGRGVPFSCFKLPYSFWVVPRVMSFVFIFCAPEIILGGTEGVQSHFLVLHSRSRFRRYRGHWVAFSCFALPSLFSAIPYAPGPIFMFCDRGLILGGTVGVRSLFLVLRSRAHVRWYRERRLLFLCFALLTHFGR